MHRCLQVPEILQSIMNAVSNRERMYHPLGVEDSSAYVAAALTCKLFYEPAMDCLWANLPSLTYLMTTLPRDAWAATHKWYHDFVLLRELAHSEWARFFVHARRVRSLHLIDGEPGYTSPTDILRAISGAVRSNKAPFPNLRHLDISVEIHGHDLPDLAFLFFCSSSLEELSMLYHDTPLQQALLTLLIGMRPATSTLSLHSWQLHSPEDSLITRYTKLRKLTIRESLPADTLYHLSSLDTLQLLDANLSLPYRVDDIVRPHDAFPNLTYLNLNFVQDADIIVPLLSRMPCHRLQRLEFMFLQPDHVIASKLNCILETIARFSALTRLDVGQSSDEPNHMPAENTCSIRPLFRLRHLEHLSLRTTLLRASFTDGAIADFGRAWQRLATLSYERSDDDETRPLPTLRVLPQVAAHLPRLAWLGLELDAADVPAPLANPLSQERVKMAFAGSAVDYEACARVAEYVASVYPRADVLINAAPDESLEAMFWTNVGSVVPVVAKLREEIRRLRVALGDEHEG